MLLSVLVPLFNEEDWISESLRRVLNAPIPSGVDLEIIVVDDGSTDNSVSEVVEMQKLHPSVIRLFRHGKNQGKGAAIRTAIGEAKGDFCLFQDADLEYSPSDYPRMLNPLLTGCADCVFGSRFITVGERRVLYYWHSVANRLITGICNMVSGLNLTDVETCYKAVRTSLIQSIPLRSKRFGIEPELTIKLAQRQAAIFETPISYYGRTYEEGKKIRFRDALQALLVMLRYGLVRDIYREKGPELLDVMANAPRFNSWMAETIRPYLGKRVMELGAGIGNLSIQLAKGVDRYAATDIDPEHVSRLGNRLQHRKKAEVWRCDLENPADFADHHSSFDSVICLNVLEHVADDLLALHNLRSLLAPGGKAIILVPEGMSVYGTLDEVLGHRRRYSEHELRSKVEQAGLHVDRMLKFNRISRPAWYVNGRILKRRTISRFQIRLFDSFVWLWRRLDPILPWAPNSLIAVAMRPK